MKAFKSGYYINQGSYKSFQPEKINRTWVLDDMELLSLLSTADRNIGRLDMYSEYVPNIDLFISMHVVMEATKSSKIEGTQTNIEEVFLEKEDLNAERRDDWEEVQNYINALNEAIGALERLPFSSRLIRGAHKTLLQGVRGEHKLPGEFRSSQNWIGGSSIDTATFVPPVHTSIHELMSDLENFAHSENPLPDVLKIALIHYQFETIHPFLDGNGRVGRLLITLYMVEKGLLKRPVLYLSDFFERNRIDYYDNLMRVRLKNDLKSWITFFLNGMIETARNSIRTLDLILKLQAQVDEKIQLLGARSSNARQVLNQLFKKPIIDASSVSTITGQSIPSSYKLVSELERLGVLHEITGLKRGKLYMFRDYLNLFK